MHTAARTTLGVLAVLAALVLVAGTADARRPVVAPGSQPVAPPPPVTPSAPPPAEDKAAPPAPKVVEPPAEEKKEPPPPKKPDVDFYGGPKGAEKPPEVKKASELENPAELRFRKRFGDNQVVLALRPGKPKPGESVEVVFTITEILRIPDPNLGDRRPLTKAKLVATVEGPSTRFGARLHATGNAGAYGLHFTPGAQGLYNLSVDRADGKDGVRFTFPVGVGVPTPEPEVEAGDDEGKQSVATARRPVGKAPAPVASAASAGPAANGSLSAIMDSLGQRWMELHRVAGTPAATAVYADLAGQVAQVPGKTPQRHGLQKDHFETLSKELAASVASLEAKVATDAAGTRAAMANVQKQTCLRCHVQYRLDLAQDTWKWPDFTPKGK